MVGPKSKYSSMSPGCLKKENNSKLNGVVFQGSHRPGKGLEFDLGPGKPLELVPFVLELSWNFVKSCLKI